MTAFLFALALLLSAGLVVVLGLPVVDRVGEWIWKNYHDWNRS